MQIDIGSDPQDLPHEGIELLREGMRRPGRFTRGAVAHRNVEVSVIVLPGPDEWVKDQIGHGVIAIVSHTQKLACGALKCIVANVGVGPFNQDGFKVDWPLRGIHRGSGGVSI